MIHVWKRGNSETSGVQSTESGSRHGNSGTRFRQIAFAIGRFKLLVAGKNRDTRHDAERRPT
eukprot:318271-Rhodomonas_salina.3